MPYNCDFKVDAGKLHITVDTTKKFGATEKGNTRIASTQGSMPVDSKSGIYVGLNVFQKVVPTLTGK